MGASFGPTLGSVIGMQLSIRVANPLDACSPLTQPSLYAGKLVLIQRGNCTFQTKVPTLLPSPCWRLSLQHILWAASHGLG